MKFKIILTEDRGLSGVMQEKGTILAVGETKEIRGIKSVIEKNGLVNKSVVEEISIAKIKTAILSGKADFVEIKEEKENKK